MCLASREREKKKMSTMSLFFLLVLLQRESFPLLLHLSYETHLIPRAFIPFPTHSTIASLSIDETLKKSGFGGFRRTTHKNPDQTSPFFSLFSREGTKCSKQNNNQIDMEAIRCRDSKGIWRINVLFLFCFPFCGVYRRETNYSFFFPPE
jgi:hypothetical protein